MPLVERRALTRLVLVQSRALPLRVLDDEGKTVVRLVLEEPCIVGDGEGALRPRLHAIGVLGYDKELTQVRGLLETAVWAGSRRRFAAGRSCRTGGLQPRRRDV